MLSSPPLHLLAPRSKWPWTGTLGVADAITSYSTSLAGGGASGWANYLHPGTASWWREMQPRNSGGWGVICTYYWDRLNHFHPYCSIIGDFSELFLGLSSLPTTLKNTICLSINSFLRKSSSTKILSHLSSSNPDRCLSLIYLLLISSKIACLSPSQLFLHVGLSLRPAKAFPTL